MGDEVKSWTFEELQQEADATLDLMLKATGAAEQRQHAIVLESLKHMAELKSTISWQAERKESHELNKQQTEAMTLVADKIPAPAPTVPVMETVLTPDYTQAPCPSVMQMGDDRYVCRLPFGHTSQHRGDGMWWTGSGNSARDAVDYRDPEPTKPAADHLHELLSYLVQQSQLSLEKSEHVMVETPVWRKHLAASKAYDDAAGKLQDILTEGSI